jgi:hypothetical protein
MISRSNVVATFGCIWAITLFASVPSIALDGSLGFSVDVSLSAPAATKLDSLKEKIVVSVLWYGEPTKAAKKRADEMGQIDLGTEQVRLPGSGGRAEIKGRSVQLKHIEWVQNRAVRASVNIFSARLSGPDNYLDCGIFDNTVVVARAKPVQIACKLIGER